MDTRELVELLTEAEEYAMDFCIDQHCEDCTARKYGVDCRKHLQADHLIANGVTVQEWISVKERYPAKSNSYICRCIVNDCDDMPFYMVLSYILYDKNPHFQHEGTGDMKVTHWMPLPEPPKEDRP